MTTALVPLPTPSLSVVAGRLDIAERCALRLFACGFLNCVSATHVDDQIEDLLARPSLDLDHLAAGDPVMALHVGPLRPDTYYRWRPWVGIDVLNRHDVGEYARLVAYTAKWHMPREAAVRLVGGIALATVSGYVHEEYALRVLGFDQANGPEGRVTRLFGVPLEDHEQALVAGRQVPVECRTHGVWEWLR